MNVPDKSQRLIDNLMELNEGATLELVRQRLADGDDPFKIIEDAQQGMRLVGLRYEERQYFISGMMMAGEIFREAMEILQPALAQRVAPNASGHILLGTVRGDIHDIGKNIFSLLLRSNGFTVTDLGVNVQPERFVTEAQRLHPDIIGLSGLLTIAYDAMKEVVQQVRQLEDSAVAHTPFILGGGTINAMVCAHVGADYWAIDAMYGVQLCKQIMAEARA